MPLSTTPPSSTGNNTMKSLAWELSDRAWLPRAEASSPAPMSAAGSSLRTSRPGTRPTIGSSANLDDAQHAAQEVLPAVIAIGAWLVERQLRGGSRSDVAGVEGAVEGGRRVLVEARIRPGDGGPHRHRDNRGLEAVVDDADGVGRLRGRWWRAGSRVGHVSVVVTRLLRLERIIVDQGGHHAIVLMIGHVAVEHPDAWVGTVDLQVVPLARPDQHRVLQPALALWRRVAVGGDDGEALPMQVHSVHQVARIDQAQSNPLAGRDVQRWDRVASLAVDQEQIVL